jgi:short subunit dehydrogenase-like uncharacterized protein
MPDAEKGLYLVKRHPAMDNHAFLLYGANGYTAQLIAREAAAFGLKPILAGRSAAVIEPLAKELGLPFRIFSLEEKDKLESALREVKVVMNGAGPFIQTARQMVEACIATGTHYLDINGDITCFELVKRYGEAAAKAGVMLMPGTGFDVVPTDCLALRLKKQLPDAVSLRIAFASLGSTLSHGTATTMASKLGEGGACRIAGKIVRRPLGEHGMVVDFGPKKRFVMSIPWGDVSTAHHTTGIPDIETFTAVPQDYFRIMKAQSLFNWLLRTDMVRNYLRRKIKSRPPGPDEHTRKNGKSLVWAEALNASGKKATARLEGPEGYDLTWRASLLILGKVLSGDFKPGYQTPASAYGEHLVEEVAGVKVS